MRKSIYAGQKINKTYYRAVLGHDAMVEALAHLTALDADVGLYPARSLEAVKNTVYEVAYAPCRARELIPASGEKGQWIRQITFRELDKTGYAKVLANLADDLPIVNIRMKEFSVTVKKIGAAYQYTVDDIAEAAHANVPLITKDAEAVHDVIEQAIEKRAWWGDTKNKLPGLLYNPNIIAAPAANGVSGTPQWSTKTNDEIVLDMSNAINDPADLTNGVERGLDTLCLPTKQLNLIKNRRMASGTDTTVYEFFLRNNPGVTIEELIWLKDLPSVPSTGALRTTTCMLAYKKDASKLTLEIPMEFTQYPPQLVNFVYKVPCKLHYAGVLVYRPMSINLVEDIA